MLGTCGDGRSPYVLIFFDFHELYGCFLGSATLAFGIRASLNLVLALLGIHRVPRYVNMLPTSAFIDFTQRFPFSCHSSRIVWRGQLQVCSDDGQVLEIQ